MLFFSAWLTHYVSDAHVPFHAVFNYDGQLTNQHGIHARFEAYLFERYRDQWTIAPKPIAAVKNPRDYIFDVVLQGTQLVPPILKSDLDAIGSARRVRRCLLRGVLQGQSRRARAPAQRVDRRLRRDDCRSVGSGGEAGDAAESEADDATSSAMKVRRKADTTDAIVVSRLQPDGGCGGGVELGPDFVTIRAAASAFSFTVFSQRRAHANSSPRMPRPIGITMNAGPGSTIMAMPMPRTVNPTMVTAMRLATRYATSSMMSGDSVVGPPEGGHTIGPRMRPAQS